MKNKPNDSIVSGTGVANVCKFIRDGKTLISLYINRSNGIYYLVPEKFGEITPDEFDRISKKLKKWVITNTNLRLDWKISPEPIKP